MKLTAKQQAALRELLEGKTLAEAAKAAGVSTSTCHRWQAEPDFAAAMKAASDEALGQAVALLKSSAVQAVKCLLAEMRSDRPLAARVGAADKLLAHGVKLLDAVELRGELEGLRAELDAIRSAPAPKIAKGTARASN